MTKLTYRGMPKDKSVGAALVLTFFFGPFGLLYSAAWWAALLMLLGAIVSGVFTWGIGAGVFWAASMIWGAIAASSKHSKYGAWLATQPQTFVSTQPQDEPDCLPRVLPPAELPAPSMDARQGHQKRPGVSAAPPAPVAQRSARGEAALREVKRLAELGLITEEEASAKRVQVLSQLFPSDDERGGHGDSCPPADGDLTSPSETDVPSDDETEGPNLEPNQETAEVAGKESGQTKAVIVADQREHGFTPQAADRRGGRRLRYAFAIGASLLVVVLAVALAVDRHHTTAQPSSTIHATSQASQSKRTTIWRTTSPGQDYGTVQFTGAQGAALTVEVLGCTVLDAALYTTSEAGDWIGGVRVRVTNEGSGPYTGRIAVNARLVDTYHHLGTVHIEADSEGQSLPDAINSISLAPGESATGVVYFAASPPVNPTVFELSPDGFSQTGKWMVV